MKRFALLCFVLAAHFADAQKVKQDLSKHFSEPTRKEILEALKKGLEPDLRMKPKLVVESLLLKNGFAYFVGYVKTAGGTEIDFRKTVYKQQVEEGVFDGSNTNALLKKVKGQWKLLVFAIGPTDIPWGCWWKEFKAPKDIFDYAEEDCSSISGK